MNKISHRCLKDDFCTAKIQKEQKKTVKTEAEKARQFSYLRIADPNSSEYLIKETGI